MSIPFLDFSFMHKPISEELKNCFDRVLNKNWFLLGEELEAFEKAYSAYNKVNFTAGVSNGLDALSLSLRSIHIGPGDEVIVPSNTYIATVLAVSYTGATPIFVEPDIRSYNLDPANIEAAITSNTKAIMPVHLYGQACDMKTIMELAGRYNLFVIEDNAQAHGATFNGKLTGSWGHINGTSFYPGKNLGALGDAGAITTNDVDLIKKVKVLRNYGSEKKYYNEVIGYNMRLDELQAAFLTTKLKYIGEWTLQRQQIALWYDEKLKNAGDLTLPCITPGSSHVYHLYVVRTKFRDELQAYLSKNKIGTLIHYPIPPHLQTAYKELNYQKGHFPIAEEIAESCLSLPIWPGMEEKHIELISSHILSFFKQINYGKK